MAESVDRLSRIFQETQAVPPVAASYREWRLWADTSAGQEADRDASDRFVQHTYFTLLARLVAHGFLSAGAPLNRREDVWEFVNGEYFVGWGLENFLGQDFFTWPFFELSMGLGTSDDATGLAQTLAAELGSFNLSAAPPDLLGSLLPGAENGAPVTARWLAEYLLGEALGLSEDPTLAVLDISCGSGTFLAAAVGIKNRTMSDRGDDSLDILLQVVDQVRGMTPSPLGAAIAKTSYLLALGDLAKEPHPPVLIPVYLADAANMPLAAPGAAGEVVHTVEAAGGLALPGAVAEDPMMLDWLFGRLPNYMRGAATRLHIQAEGEAVQEVLNAYYNYLTAPKTRTPIPEPLTHDAAEVMVETARALVMGYIRGEGHARLYTIKNAAAPVFLSRRKFALVANSAAVPDWSAFSQECTANYLEEGGAALVLAPPRPACEQPDLGQQAWRSAIQIEDSSGVPTLTVFYSGAGSMDGLNIRVLETFPDGNPSWPEAKEHLVITPSAGMDHR